ncbi:proteinase inhibitor I4 serpin [Arthrobacter sp. SW1]|uniref:serpin family protein n=1 Tax=Arthrobacter sp. SW1 TaxID=1920889 RepID=UPI000877B2D5|nr:serpin family protein [Arthrobacter sp. SW1]OFI38699.1 proteinase inhibitor I4 serpin [Arthrobacter sp. SW1]
MNLSRLLALGAVAALAACSVQAPASQPSPELLKSEVQRAAVKSADFPTQLAAYRASALKLGVTLLADGGEEPNGNVVSSPGSLLIALSMLRAGASGKTAAEMDKVLGLPADERDEAMNALLASLEKFDGDPASVDEKNPPRTPLLHTANGLFINKGTPTGKGYLDTLARHYGTGVYPVDFQDKAVTEPAIDAWVEKNTGGRIKKAPVKFDPKDTFSLLNAVYFAGAWKVPFDSANTQDRPFTTASGETATVPTMSGVASVAYVKGEGWQAVDLPYADGFAMRLVLPDESSDGGGQLPSDTLDAGTLAAVASALGKAAPSPVAVTLPRWDHKSKFDLKKMLVRMGLTETFSTDRDFNAIQRGMFLTAAAQAANITVAEKGTVAAAVTQINARESSALIPPQSIVFDRPFHYQVVHQETGLPLFMGQVADPR